MMKTLKMVHRPLLGYQHMWTTILKSVIPYIVDEKPTPEKIDTKDGGYGWVIVVAACLIQVAGGGISQAW